MQRTYFVPRNTPKLTTRGGTSPEGVEMTLIRERKSTHRLGTKLHCDGDDRSCTLKNMGTSTVPRLGHKESQCVYIESLALLEVLVHTFLCLDFQTGHGCLRSPVALM